VYIKPNQFCNKLTHIQTAHCVKLFFTILVAALPQNYTPPSPLPPPPPQKRQMTMSKKENIFLGPKDFVVTKWSDMMWSHYFKKQLQEDPS
jgi:hypothetical protein